MTLPKESATFSSCRFNFLGGSLIPNSRYWERVEFVTGVTKLAGVRRQTFFNWKCMACRIPEHAKQIIEDEAGKRIFDDTPPDTERAQP